MSMRGWIAAGVVAVSLISVETGILISENQTPSDTTVAQAADVTPTPDATQSASTPVEIHTAPPKVKSPVRQPAPVHTHHVYRRHVTPRTSAPHSSSPKPTASTPAHHFVTAGAFCSSQGAHGVTSTGRAMTCKPSATDSRNRWRS